MKTLLFVIMLSLNLFAQTEFYLSTARAPFFNNCRVVKDSLPIRCTIDTVFRLNAIVWNPDSTEWCTTREGYYRSAISGTGIQWRIDGTETTWGSTDGISVFTLDTLEHTVEATYLQFPKATVRYKARSDLPFLVCSKNRNVFGADSIRMRIRSYHPAMFGGSSKVPAITDDSCRQNSVIMTFDSPTDTSIKLTAFMHRNGDYYGGGGLFLETLNQKSNSYSVMVPLVQMFYLVKKQSGSRQSLIFDTVVAVFKRQSSSDTVMTVFSMASCLGGSSVAGPDVSPAAAKGSTRLVYRMYDLRGRMVSRYAAGSIRSSGRLLPKGVYMLDRGRGKPGEIRPAVLAE